MIEKDAQHENSELLNRDRKQALHLLVSARKNV